MIGSEDAHGRLQIVLATVGNFCLVKILFWGVVGRMAGRTSQNPSVLLTDVCLGVANTLFHIVGGIPVAMPTVLSVTLAIVEGGARSDKTGTLTLNQHSEMASFEVIDEEVPPSLLQEMATFALSDVATSLPDITGTVRVGGFGVNANMISVGNIYTTGLPINTAPQPEVATPA
ncbi:hypothetical protein PHYPSEUDO_000703 [Phytophthora pseudosyringae]|uniref:Uncharacterized protein n=1 Tax=Phytophthora pseudosyringae TaxID=221518 RepID=A0A8T1VXL2_9STRA|nr:hypothetical protein PHYPSEUDO_000703 [Phytophthora pseudosyringae]